MRFLYFTDLNVRRRIFYEKILLLLKNRVEVKGELAKAINRMNVNAYRRRKRDEAHTVFFESDEMMSVYANVSVPSYEAECENKEMREAIRNIIKTKLSARQREAVIYVFYEEMTLKQAADAMGVNLTTVSTYIERALVKIKLNLENMDLI